MKSLNESSYFFHTRKFKYSDLDHLRLKLGYEIIKNEGNEYNFDLIKYINDILEKGQDIATINYCAKFNQNLTPECKSAIIKSLNKLLECKLVNKNFDTEHRNDYTSKQSQSKRSKMKTLIQPSEQKKERSKKKFIPHNNNNAFNTMQIIYQSPENQKYQSIQTSNFEEETCNIEPDQISESTNLNEFKIDQEINKHNVNFSKFIG